MVKSATLLTLITCTLSLHSVGKNKDKEILEALKFIEHNIEHASIQTALVAKEVLDKCSLSHKSLDITRDPITNSSRVCYEKKLTHSLQSLLEKYKQQKQIIAQQEIEIKQRRTLLATLLTRLEQLEKAVRSYGIHTTTGALATRSVSPATTGLNGIFDNAATRLNTNAAPLTITTNSAILENSIVGAGALGL